LLSSGGDSPAVILSYVAGQFGELTAQAFPAKAEALIKIIYY
jgi:hypothetical protein